MKKTLVCLVSAALALAACSGSKAEKSSGKSAAELPPFRIAVITPLTGGDPYGGNEFKNGAELAEEHLGGQINGRKIQVVVADGPNQDATISEFERLCEQGITCFYSGYGSIADRSFATLADEMKVLYLSLAWDIDLIQGKSDYFSAPAPGLTITASGSTISRLTSARNTWARI